MQIEKNDIYFLIACILTFSGVTFVKMYDLYTSYTLITSSLTFVLSTLIIIWGYRQYFGFAIVQDGLLFFDKKIKKYAKKGGVIFTTAIFDDYSQGDFVTMQINANTYDFLNDLTFQRLMLLDDATQETKWINDFLSIKKNNFTPQVYNLNTVKRSTARKIRKTIPRFSISIYQNRNGNPECLHIGLPGYNFKFGLATQNKRICKIFHDYISLYKQESQLLVEPIEFSNQSSNSGFLSRIVESICESLDLPNSFIDYAGVFGGQGLYYNKRLSQKQKHDLEGDLDLIIVIREEIDIPDAKKLITKMIEMQNFENIKYTIEWSNLENKYYVYRSPVHIDIQLHKSGDLYYKERALLGFSIFDESHYVLFSRGKKPIWDHIPFPLIPLTFKERISLALNDEEYGIRTAHQRLMDDKLHSIDPNRILWICLQNYFWALSGIRVRVKKIIYDLLNRKKWFHSIGAVNKQVFKIVYHTSNSDVQFEQNSVIYILKNLIEDLENE